MVPGLWFQMRLAYSRSVATTSIVGHVVGLGDRHISNILIDQNSGELIHIDLGIAFDQVCVHYRLVSTRSLMAS
jgi:ataxia telangiectasia mutated family protein